MTGQPLARGVIVLHPDPIENEWCIFRSLLAKPILYYVSDIDNLTIKSEASKLYIHSLTPDTTMTIVDDAGLAKSTILTGSDEPPKHFVTCHDRP